MAGNPRWLLLLSVAICYCSLFAESQAAATWKSGPAGQKAKFQPAKSGLTSGKLFGKLLSKATSHGFASMHEKLSLLSAKTAAVCCANLFLSASDWNESPVLGSYSFSDNDNNGNPVYLHESGSFVLFNPEVWAITDMDFEYPIAAEAVATECAEDNVGGWGWYDPDNGSVELDSAAMFTCV